MTDSPLSKEQQALLHELTEQAPADAIIGHLTRRLHQAFNSGWLANAPMEVTPPQLLMLTFLSRFPGSDQISLAYACSMDRSTTATLVKSLEKANLLTRTRDPNDGRRWCLNITPQGQDIVDICNAEVPAVNKKVLKNLNPEQIEQLTSLIKLALGPT
ncbi:hypothetical protein R50073_13420 [Maricurvus nonylphenolicus]|uniref:MarR family winged helix-turn-helix transcriptional regulator n=1 Tax=Maricurvus nonylphenolicus TaxID=1008307 RepID=UPI0036F2BBD8